MKMIKKMIQNEIETSDASENLFNKVNELIDAINDLEKRIEFK